MTGAVFYEGPSLLTGAPIIGVVTGLTGRSRNSKTGAMAQALVIRSDVSPMAAVSSGGDDAICGNCRHRSGSNIGRSCYVVWWMSPNNVYRKYRKGRYDVITPSALASILSGKFLRITEYGDAAAIPADAWLTLTKHVAGWAGYTHQWASCDQRLRAILMASVDSIDEMTKAAALGWRTFRVRGEALTSNEVICPASSEGGYSTTCIDCQLCRGEARQAKSVAILPHGQRVKWLTLAKPIEL